jgi:hypothetical protein
MSQWQVVGYRITYMSTSSVAWKAEIRCYGSTELSEPEVALIRFYLDPNTIPDDGWVGDNVNGVPIVNYPLSAFEDIVTILRDEDYVTVTTFSYSSRGSWVEAWGVSSGMEDVGDMEP